MIKSHLVLLVVFSGLVSTVFAALLRDDPKSRWRFGLKAFGAFLLTTLALGWLMYPFPN